MKKICLLLAMLAFCGVGRIEGATTFTMYFFTENNTIYCSLTTDANSMITIVTDEPANKFLGSIETEDKKDIIKLYETSKPTNFETNKPYITKSYIQFTADLVNSSIDNWLGKDLMNATVSKDVTVMQKITEFLSSKWELKKKKETLEKERLEKERLEKERLEKERLEKERLEKEKLEKEKKEEKPKIEGEKKPESEYEMYLDYNNVTLKLTLEALQSGDKYRAIFKTSENLKPATGVLAQLNITDENRKITVYYLLENIKTLTAINLDDYKTKLVQDDVKFLDKQNAQKISNLAAIKKWLKELKEGTAEELEAAKKQQEADEKKAEELKRKLEETGKEIDIWAELALQGKRVPNPLYDLAFILSKM